MSNLDDDLEWLIDDNPTYESSTTEKENLQAEIQKSEEHYLEDDTDSDGDGLTPEERDLLERNTILNDASDREDYDLKIKVEKANADLEKTDTNKTREVKVMFKQKLIDVEAPPLDYGSSSSSSSSESEDESSETRKVPDKDSSDEAKVTENGEKDKILVERGGKFQLINPNEEMTNSSKLPDQVKTKNTVEFTAPTPTFSVARPLPTKTRPTSAPTSGIDHHRNDSARPMSASRSSEYDHIKSPYAMSSEMKELMRKRAAARAAREEEEQAQIQLKKEEERQNAEYAWKCWVEKKNSESREKKKAEEEQKPKETYDSKKEAEEAYALWLKEKRKQMRRDRLMQQQQQLEFDEAWYRRDRKECDKAFKQWMNSKRETARREKLAERRLGQQTRSDAFRMRKIRRLLLSIKSSESSSYSW